MAEARGDEGKGGEGGGGEIADLHKLLAGKFPVCLGPLHLPGVSLHFEVLVALASAELENLQEEQAVRQGTAQGGMAVT